MGNKQDCTNDASSLDAKVSIIWQISDRPISFIVMLKHQKFLTDWWSKAMEGEKDSIVSGVRQLLEIPVRSIPYTDICDLHYFLLTPVEYTIYQYMRPSQNFLSPRLSIPHTGILDLYYFFYYPGWVYHIQVYSTFTNFFITPVECTVFWYNRASLIFYHIPV